MRRGFRACLGARPFRRKTGGFDADDRKWPGNDRSGSVGSVISHAGGRGRSGCHIGRGCGDRLSRRRQRHPPDHARPAGRRQHTGRQGLSADARCKLAAGRRRGRHQAHDRGDRYPPAAAAAARQPVRDRQAHRGAEGRARQFARRDCGSASAAQIRRTLCRSLARRARREGRGAPALRMARGLHRRVRGGRQRRHRDPRGRAQAARHRSRYRAAGERSRRQAAGKARGADRSRRASRDQGDAAGDLCGAQCALDAALRCAARYRCKGPQARAGTGAPRRDRPDHRRGLVECRARRLHRAHRARRQRAGARLADRAIPATAAAARRQCPMLSLRSA